MHKYKDCPRRIWSNLWTAFLQVLRSYAVYTRSKLSNQLQSHSKFYILKKLEVFLRAHYTTDFDSSLKFFDSDNLEIVQGNQNDLKTLNRQNDWMKPLSHRILSIINDDIKPTIREKWAIPYADMNNRIIFHCDNAVRCYCKNRTGNVNSSDVQCFGTHICLRQPCLFSIIICSIPLIIYCLLEACNVDAQKGFRDTIPVFNIIHWVQGFNMRQILLLRHPKLTTFFTIIEL
uniref:Uncharacterized protein n=1 Tax=Glossina brevipalpis TaxID=37001 RepID=A0A1A9W7K3_9MUSC